VLVGFPGIGACRPDDGSARAREVPDTASFDTAVAAMVTGSDSSLVDAARRLIPEVSRESGLSVVRRLAVARTTRSKLNEYLLGELADELPAERAQAVTAVYARLGLLPDSVDLLGLLRKLYLEQVVGYYDARRDTLYVREGVGEELFRPVLVHEMVHALQDEHEDLDSLVNARRDDNDASSAARAALEGQATFVMLEWQLRRTLGRDVDLTAMPSVASLIGSTDVMAAGAGSSPELAGAPPFIQQSLLFPYMAGLAFVQALWKERPGRPAPLGADMPASTEQVLHPRRFLSSPRDAPTSLSFTDSLDRPAGTGWREVHTDDLGEFETRAFLSAFLGDTARAASAAKGWDGDRYRLLRRCGAGAEETACPEALVWASVWDDAPAADSFVVAVKAAEAARYGARTRAGEGTTGGGAGLAPPASRLDTLAGAGRILEVRRLEVDGRPAVIVVDAPAEEDVAPVRAAARFTVRGGG